MKHNKKITIILLSMFLVTQIIGLAVVHTYIPQKQTIIENGIEKNITKNPLPYGMQPPEIRSPDEYWSILPGILIAFVVAITLVFVLSKIRVASVLKYWFFIVVIMALGITLNAIFFRLNLLQNYFVLGFSLPAVLAALIALPLAYFKIFRQNFLIHNLSELLIYPGIAAVFVPILSVWTIIILLIAISLYDLWAVWHSGFMQKMAKYQINHLKIFAGFFVPYMNKKERDKVKALKIKYKNKKIPEKAIKSKNIKVSMAILGGGDVIFPIIAAGVFLYAFGWLPALMVTLFSTIALGWLFIGAKKGKFYPAMPFLSAGIFIGMLVGWLLTLI